MSQPVNPPHRPSRRSQVDVPALACDTHAHVFVPEGVYPYAPRRPYTPAAGTDLTAYRTMLQTLGIARAVLVHSNIYGPDNRATTDALAAMGGQFRGVALIRPDIDDAALSALDEAGMRGIRINLEFPGELDLAGVEAMAGRLAGLGWHLQLLVKLDQLPRITERLTALPLDVVVDHMGLPASDASQQSSGFGTLLALLETGRCWVKLSAPYYAKADGPAYAHGHAIAQTLFRARPDRMLWGSNWPHPLADPVPQDGELMDWIAKVTENEAGLHQVLVDNPARLYRFTPG